MVSSKIHRIRYNQGNSSQGTVLIRQSTIARNLSAHEGGGIVNRLGEVTVVNSAIVNNSAGDGAGGGIFTSGGNVIIRNSTLTGNRARSFRNPCGSGGAIGGGPVSLTNSTIAENVVDCLLGLPVHSGGGVRGAVTLQNTILAHNKASNFSGTSEIPDDCVGTVTSLDNNLIGDPTGCTITLQPSDLTGDPGLDTFTDDGTPGNGHFPLLPTSQAIDAGNDAVCPRRDQLGQRRIGPCDIGAIRFLDHTDLLHEDDPATAAQAAQ
jgi:hypothetical protein